jgi:hypothetical protein
MNHPRLIGLSLVLGAGLLLACGGDDPPPAPLVDCTMVTAKKYSELTIWPLCVSCHSSALSGAARMLAPVGTNFDSYEAAKARAPFAASRVNLGQMPPAGSPQPSATQKAELIAWATCGTPN